MTLFVDRARQVDTRFVLDDATGLAAARLVTRLDGTPLAIELAAARVEALGVAQLLDRLDDRFALLSAGDRLAAGRHRSLAATVEWSYQLLDNDEQRVFRALSVFPGPFTLEAAEAVAGPGAGLAVLHLVDCSLLVPPREGPDGRSRYGMLETLRAYGAGLLAGAGEQDGAAAALAGWTMEVAEQAAAGLWTAEGEAAAARWLDAEDAATRQVLAWAMENDPAAALRLAAALAWWWVLRGRWAGNTSLVREAAGRAAPGSGQWCAALAWLGYTAQWRGDLAASLSDFTALRDAVTDRGQCRALAEALTGRAAALNNMGRYGEGAEEGRLALAAARQADYPAGEAEALRILSFAAIGAGDHGSAVRLARQAGQLTAGIGGRTVRMSGYALTWALIAAGDLAAAEPVCAATLARCREVGDVWTVAVLLPGMVLLDLEAGRIQNAAAHVREAVELDTRSGSWLGLYEALDSCGHLCAATGRFAEAVTI